MSRWHSTETLSFDTITSLKHFCYGNISEFYRRHGDHFDMSRATFSRIMGGSASDAKNIDQINQLCYTLGISDPDTKKMSLSYRTTLSRRLIMVCEVIIADPSLKNLKNLIDFLKSHKETMLL